MLPADALVVTDVGFVRTEGALAATGPLAAALGGSSKQNRTPPLWRTVDGTTPDVFPRMTSWPEVSPASTWA